MQTIHKYPITIDDEFTIQMPTGSKILCVQVQHDVPCIWALVDDALPKVPRTFLLRGTGHDCDDLRISRSSYVGTFQLRGGGLVFHLFQG